MDVKELAERLKKIANTPKMDMEGNPSEDGFRPGMWITAEEAELFLSALGDAETVAGIEMLTTAQESGGITLTAPSPQQRNWEITLYTDDDDYNLRESQNYFGDSPHSAVRAAVEAAGKGE